MNTKGKICPECGYENFRVAAVCKSDGCGHVFFEKKPRKKRKAREIDPASQAGFSAGLAEDGALLMFWYGKGEFTKLTPEETSLVRAVLKVAPTAD